MKDNTMNDGHLTITAIFEADPNFSDLGMFELSDIVTDIGGESNWFDWKDWKDGEAWEDKMNSKGYEVRNIDDGSDSYSLLAIPNSKIDLIEFIAQTANIPLTYPEWGDEL